MMRKLSAVVLTLALLTGLVLTVFAAEAPDLTRKGSVTFTMDYEGTALNGGFLTITRVGTIVEKNGEYQYELLSSLGGGPALDDLESPLLAQELARMAKEKNLPVKKARIRNGQAVFANLELGLYLVTQSAAEATDGFYPISPFLMTIPQYADGYVYDVAAAPKMEPGQPTETTEPTETTQPTETTELPGGGLPQTGQLNWPVPILIVAGLAFFTAGWYLSHDKRERYEN